MNHMIINGQYAPEEKQQVLFCEACGNRLSDIEEIDPCEIDDRIFCDTCAGNLTQLRLDGYIDSAASKTRALRITEDIFETLGAILNPTV